MTRNLDAGARISARVNAQFLVLLAALALGCGSPQPTATLAPAALHNETAEGPFRLTFDLPTDTWQAGQPITGEARLELTQGGPRVLGGSGHGVIGFSYSEVSGRRRMGDSWTADCARHQITPDEPQTSELTKSVGYSSDDPDAAFYRAFIEGPDVVLPEGLWDITAVTYFIDSVDATCSGRSYEMRTTVRIAVVP